MSEIVYEFSGSVPADAVVELYRAGGWWREDSSWLDAIPRMIAGSFCFLTARETGGRIVGMGRVLSDGASDAYIQDVVVLDAFRDRGIGTEIVRRLTERCVESRICWIGLVAEPGTQPFYEKLGYRAVPGHQLMLHGRHEA